jgi:hypothetical protein
MELRLWVVSISPSRCIVDSIGRVFDVFLFVRGAALAVTGVSVRE